MTRKPTFDYDIIVIGSGAAGSPAASLIAQAGKRVALIEQAAFGGESPNWGDVPLSAMLHASHLYAEAKAGARFGLRTGAIGHNYPSFLSWRDTVIKRTGAANNHTYYEKQGIHTFRGTAHFLSPNEISVNRRHLSARQFLITTGSHWSAPAIPGLSDTPYYTPQTLMTLTRPPKTLAIIGADATALEIADLMATFGTKVYILTTADRIAGSFDREVSDLLSQHLTKEYGMSLLTQSNIVSVGQSGIRTRTTYTRGGHTHTLSTEALMVASQRQPATDLGLENAGVTYTARGITVDNYLQTSARHIYAAGGVTDTSLETHAILAQSRTAAHNLLQNKRIIAAHGPSLHTMQTRPAAAQVGLTEEQCQRRGRHITTAIAPLTLTARSNFSDQRLGFVKLIADRKGVLIGGTVVAPDAEHIIQEVALAVTHGLSAHAIVQTPHSFLSFAEAVRIAAGKLL